MISPDEIDIEMVYTMAPISVWKRFSMCVILLFGGKVDVHVRGLRKNLEESIRLMDQQKVL